MDAKLFTIMYSHPMFPESEASRGQCARFLVAHDDHSVRQNNIWQIISPCSLFYTSHCACWVPHSELSAGYGKQWSLCVSFWVGSHYVHFPWRHAFCRTDHLHPLDGANIVYMYERKYRPQYIQHHMPSTSILRNIIKITRRQWYLSDRCELP